jgi:hypothetical protein
MAGILTRVMQRIGSNPDGLDEPMVNEPMNFQNALYIPVAKSGGPANWSIRSGDQEYIVPQTQDEHNRLLNTFYPDRGRLKNWKELGQEEEKKSPHFSDKDSSTRKNLRARSSVIKDIAYDAQNGKAWLKMGDKWYEYRASPSQFQQFMASGSLGREMNNIKHNRSMSMSKITPPGSNPNLKTGYQSARAYSALSGLASGLSNIYNRLLGR